MTKEELEKEAEEWTKEHSGLIGGYKFVKYDYDSMQKAYLASAEPREKRITELEVQIEKMKCCQNCENKYGQEECANCHNYSKWKFKQAEQFYEEIVE